MPWELQALPSHDGDSLGTVEHVQAKLRAASNHTGPWPKLSIWHGTADRTVEVYRQAVRAMRDDLAGVRG